MVDLFGGCITFRTVGMADKGRSLEAGPRRLYWPLVTVSLCLDQLQCKQLQKAPATRDQDTPFAFLSMKHCKP